MIGKPFVHAIHFLKTCYWSDADWATNEVILPVKNIFQHCTEMCFNQFIANWLLFDAKNVTVKTYDVFQCSPLQYNVCVYKYCTVLHIGSCNCSMTGTYITQISQHSNKQITVSLQLVWPLWYRNIIFTINCFRHTFKVTVIKTLQ